MDIAEQMDALVLEGPRRLIRARLPVPPPGAGEVLIRVHHAAICGSDVRIVAGTKTRDVRYGHPIGHEVSGQIAAVGAEVTGYQPGDRVAICVVESCGQCDFCRADRENLCTSRRTLGYHTDGAFAEYMLIPARAVSRGNVFKLPASVPLEVGPLIEPLACCLNGQHEMGLAGMADSADTARRLSLVIFGAGPIGLLHLLLARVTLGDRLAQLTMVEPRSGRREWALRLGADAACDPREFPADGHYDAAIVAAGVSDIVPLALRSLEHCGRLSLFAGFDAGASVQIDPNLIHYRQLRIYGASESRRRDFRESLELIAAGRVQPSPLVTHRFTLDQAEQAFRVASDGSAIKVAFKIQRDQT